MTPHALQAEVDEILASLAVTPSTLRVIHKIKPHQAAYVQFDADFIEDIRRKLLKLCDVTGVAYKYNHEIAAVFFDHQEGGSYDILGEAWYIVNPFALNGACATDWTAVQSMLNHQCYGYFKSAFVNRLGSFEKVRACQK